MASIELAGSPPQSSRQLPVELISRIISYIPQTQLTTLSTLFRVSKVFFAITARRVYEHVSITPEVDLMVDTGLPARLIDLDDSPSTFTGNDVSREEQSHVGGSNGSSGADFVTLKHRLLKLIRTLEIYPTQTLPGDPRELAPLLSPALTASSQPFHLETLRIQLDSTDLTRRSPLRPLSFYNPIAPAEGGSGAGGEGGQVSSTADEQLPPAVQQFLARVTVRRLIISGAGFLQTAYPLTRLPPSLLRSVEAVYIIIPPITGHAGAPTSTNINTNHGLPFILQCLLISPIPYSAPITFIIDTPRPGRRVSMEGLTPHGHMAMTMEYNPDYAPGYLNGLTMLLAREMVDAVKDNSEAREREITYVNFGGLDGEDMGMPQAAVEEMENRFRRGLRVRLRRSGSQARLEGAEGWATVLGMREWLEKDRKESEAVLGADTLKGWLP